MQKALASAGLDCEVREFPASTRTAREAAAAIGCQVAAIAKTIVFKASQSGEAVLVVASGTNRVDEARVAAVIGESVEQATPDFVRAQTGFSIGGVPPCGHPHPLRVVVDRDLLQLDSVWAAAGTPNAVFAIAPSKLQSLTDGTLADIASAR